MEAASKGTSAGNRFVSGCPVQQRVPIVGRISPVQHPSEHRVRIRAASVRTQSAGVVHPRVEDDPHVCSEPEEQAKSSVAELCPAPMLSLLSQSAPLPEFWSPRIAWDQVVHKIGQRGEQLFVSACSRRLAVRPSPVHCAQNPLHLVEEERVHQQGPAVLLDQLGRMFLRSRPLAGIRAKPPLRSLRQGPPSPLRKAFACGPGVRW